MAEKKKPSELVVVEVREAIAFGGVLIAPNVDKNGKVTLVRAIVPRAKAEAHPDERVKILKDAPDDAKVGVVSQA